MKKRPFATCLQPNFWLNLGIGTWKSKCTAKYINVLWHVFFARKKFNAIFKQILEPLCLFAFVRWIYIRPTGDKIWVRRVELRLPGLKFFLEECPYVWCKYPWWGKKVWDLGDAFDISRVTSKWDLDTWFGCWRWVSCIQYLTVNIWKK